MAAPIPERLLVDTALVEDPDAGADYAGGFAEPRTLRHVRLDAAAYRQADTWHDDSPQGGAVLFVDSANTEPPEPPVPGARVTVERGGAEVYEGITSEVQACLDESGIHHWEVTFA